MTKTPLKVSAKHKKTILPPKIFIFNNLKFIQTCLFISKNKIPYLPHFSSPIPYFPFSSARTKFLIFSTTYPFFSQHYQIQKLKIETQNPKLNRNLDSCSRSKFVFNLEPKYLTTAFSLFMGSNTAFPLSLWIASFGARLFPVENVKNEPDLEAWFGFKSLCCYWFGFCRLWCCFYAVNVVVLMLLMTGYDVVKGRFGFGFSMLLLLLLMF